MKAEKNNQRVSNKETEVVAEKREFMKKFGKYAVVGAGMAVLMSPKLSAAEIGSLPVDE